MGKQPISSAAKRVRGSITEALGKLTGDKITEKKGTAQKQAAEAELKAAARNPVTARKHPALKLGKGLRGNE